ncbi:MAG: hypothetical protein ACFFBD_09375 [Candidatus Hodarchaeota archaeon]
MSKPYKSLTAQVRLLRIDCQFRVHDEYISQELSISLKDPCKEFFALEDVSLAKRLEPWAQATQLLATQEHLELNDELLQWVVVATTIKYWNANSQFPVIHLVLKSGRITLRPGFPNRVILRRQEAIQTYETSETWFMPGRIIKAISLNLLRSPNDKSFRKMICGRRVDFVNGESRITGGTVLIEFKYGAKSLPVAPKRTLVQRILGG